LADRIQRRVPGHRHVARLLSLADQVETDGAAIPTDKFTGRDSVENRLTNIGSKLASVGKMLSQREGPVRGSAKESYIESPQARAAQVLSGVYKSLSNEHQRITGKLAAGSSDFVRSTVGGIKPPVSRMFIEVLKRRAAALGSQKETPMGDLTSESKYFLSPFKKTVVGAKAKPVDRFATLEDSELVKDADGNPIKYPEGHALAGKFVVKGKQRVDSQTGKLIVFQGVEAAPTTHITSTADLPAEQHAFIDTKGNASHPKTGMRYRANDVGPDKQPVVPHPTHYWEKQQNDSLSSRVDVGTIDRGRLE
jgi:hypothetical protein